MARKRKNGEGTVRLRKDGRWEGRVVIGYDDQGYPKTKNVLAKTKSECAEKLKALKEQYAAPKSDAVKSDMPFGEWMDFWYQNYSKPKLRPTTQAGYECRIYQHIIPELGDIPLNQLTQNDLQQFYARLKKSGRLLHAEHYGAGLSDSMVRASHMNCRAALEKAVQEGLIRVNPAVGCKLPPKKAKEMQVLTREEIQRFLIQAKAEGYFELFLLELTTGLRRGELLALQWDDLNFESGELKITKQVYRTKEDGLLISQPKTKSSIRTISLPQPLLAILKEYKEGVNSRWIFPSPLKEDSPLDPAYIRTRLHLILEHAQCKEIRFHDLRHTFATMALGSGMDVKTLSSMLGHVSAATTLDIYTHITNPMRSEAAAKIDQKIAKADPKDRGTDSEQIPEPMPQPFVPFIPYNGKIRKAGTGCITQISEHCWEGRYSPVWPDGKKHSRNVYAKTREECEAFLPGLIQQMKAEIKAIKESGNLDAIPDGISEKKKAIAAYMREHPEVTSKSAIAKVVGIDRSTVRKYYNEIRSEMGQK